MIVGGGSDLEELKDYIMASMLVREITLCLFHFMLYT